MLSEVEASFKFINYYLLFITGRLEVAGFKLQVAGFNSKFKIKNSKFHCIINLQGIPTLVPRSE